MSKIRLEIVTPDKGEVFSQDIDMLIVRTIAGELGILPKHARLLTELIPYPIKIKVDGSEHVIAVSGGFIEVTPDLITVLADAAELPEDIDVDRAKAAHARAVERIKMFKESVKAEYEIDIKRANAALARAKARLLIKNISVD